jgi:predicted nucleic acid-binding protein
MDEQEIAQVLDRRRLIALDSCVLIYALEGHDKFGALAKHVMKRVQQGRNQAVLSTLALLEAQVGPYRQGDLQTAHHYYSWLTRLANCRWVALTYEIADLAAQLRAERRLNVPDAIHLATAVESRAEVFITNDTALPLIPEIAYLILGKK